MGIRKTAAKFLAVSIVILGAVELAGILYSKGIRNTGYEEAQKERDAVLRELPSPSTEGLSADPRVFINGTPREIHPYFAFTLRRDFRGVNNAGFPAPSDYPYVSDENEYVVGIAGGSLAIVQALSTESRQILEEGILRLVAPMGFEKVTVLCLASGGWRQPQTFYALTYYLDTLDMVIVIDGFNEVSVLTEEAAMKWPPRYPWKSLYALFASPGVSQGDLLAIGNVSLLNNRIRRVTRWMSETFLRYSLFAHSLWKIWARRMQALAREKYDHFLDTLLGGYIDYSTIAAGSHDEARVQIDDYFRFYGNLSYWQSRIADMQDVPYFHFIQPNQYVQGSKPYSDEEKQKYLSGGEEKMRRITGHYERLEGIVQDLSGRGVNAVSLAGVFAETEQTVYMDDCCHLNERGTRIVAEAVMDHIENVFAH